MGSVLPRRIGRTPGGGGGVWSHSVPSLHPLPPAVVPGWGTQDTPVRPCHPAPAHAQRHGECESEGAGAGAGRGQGRGEGREEADSPLRS